jgi:hypothetical protein
MRLLTTLALVATVLVILFTQYGLGAGLLALCLAVIVFIGTALEVVETAVEGDAAIARTIDDADIY